MRVLLCCLIFLGLLFQAEIAVAQPDTLWTRHIQYGNNPLINAALELEDGGFILAGVTDPNAVDVNMLVIRVSSGGEVVWTRSLGAANRAEQAAAIVQTFNGDLVVIGYAWTGPTPNQLVLTGLSLEADSLWMRSYTSNGWTQGNDACLLPDGNIAIVGYRLGSDGIHSDAWLLKCTPTGDTLWTRMLGGADTDLGNRVLPGSNGQIIVAGVTKTWTVGDYDLWLLITDSMGTVVVNRSFGTTSVERCYGMTVTDEGIYLAGRSGTDVSNRGFIAKTSLAGDPLWSQSYTVGQTDEQLRGIVPRRGGGVRCVGYAGVNTLNPYPWILDTNSDGVQEQSWVNLFRPQSKFFGILPVHSGGALLFGSVTESGYPKIYLVRLPQGGGITGVVQAVETGQPVHAARVGVVGSARYVTTDALGRFRLELTPGTYDVMVWGPCVSSDTTPGITVAPDSIEELTLTTGIPKFISQQSSVNIVVYNQVLTHHPFVIRNIGTGPMEYAVVSEPVIPPTSWFTVVPDHGYVPARDSVIVSVDVLADTTNNGVFDFYGYLNLHLRACPDSTARIPVLVTVLDVPEMPDVLPRDPILHAAYPNPFNPSTTLSFTLPREGSVRLEIYNLQGRLVQVLAEGRHAAGKHRVNFSGESLAAGVYLCRFESGPVSATQKLLLLK
ncbi:T9SS C-terminal target domain-containing protein [candidate division KSB1 bacterium]|nr:MAG: T9SS C-terminal target domain-containing protein [candidate division KSB1 bacterium]